MYFLVSFSFKLTLSASLSCTWNCKPLCTHLCEFKLFLLGATKNNHIYSCKNGQFGTQFANTRVGMDWFFRSEYYYKMWMQIWVPFTTSPLGHVH
jgi:hypothetical protein